MSPDSYDALAKVLRELPGRFGATIFADRRRVVSVLSDRVPEARREIKVLGSAIDDGVFEALATARPEQIGLEVDRLAARIETNLGIRSDIAVPVVRACAYGLGRGPLPSEYGMAGMSAPMAAPVPRSQPDGSWVGVSQPVGMPGGGPSAPVPRHQPEGSWVGVSTPVGAQMPPYGAQGAWASAGAGAPAGSPAGYPAAPHPGGRPGGARPEWLKWVLIGGGALIAILAIVFLIDAMSPRPAPDPKIPKPQDPKPRVDPKPKVEPRRSDQAERDDPQTRPVTPPTGPYADETKDFGVAPQRTLQVQGRLGSPTPTTIPVGIVLTTRDVYEELRKNTDFLLLDVLEPPHPQTIIKARTVPYGGRPGSFNDDVQRQFTNDLAGLTQNRRQHPIVFFCEGPNCWESYNALLRAYEAGYRNLYWYRGGLAAWRAANLPMQPVR